MTLRLKYIAAASLAVFAFWGCTPADNLQEENIQIDRPAPSAAKTSADTNSGFQAVLDEFTALNKRLDNIASRLKTANADLCPQTEADIGFSTHTLKDYPEPLQPAARHFLNVGHEISARAVRANSQAAKAGVQAGDQIISINAKPLNTAGDGDQSVISSHLAKAIWQAELGRAAYGETVAISYKRGAQTFSSAVIIGKQCKLPVTLFYSENVNGHYVDGEIWMTSGLLREVKDDTQIAYILAHELAHALHHKTAHRSAKTELEADRIGLIILARAGYDPAELAQFWAEQIDLFDGGIISSETHPDLAQRADNFALTLSYIHAAKDNSEALKALIGDKSLIID